MSVGGRRIEIRGTVQGVGFRPWVWRLARTLGVRGSVLNDDAGVTIEAFGSEAALDRFVFFLQADPPPVAVITSLHSTPLSTKGPASFCIAESRGAPERRVCIPPDLATCADCLREIFDPTDRRYRYPFTTCTQCGPRFTIARGVPYDRARTTMASFDMCPACRREYEDPESRRFHAQPNACPACGPRLHARDAGGAALPIDDPLSHAAHRLREGAIVAVKGLGGYHLTCDATRPEVVRRLRERKRRDRKPFAVMVRDIAEAERVARLSAEERALLASLERPIVLVERLAHSGLAPEIAPDNSLVGLLLPYTPLHHLLLHETERPLVMTSGNLSGAPLAFENEEAITRLRGVVDLVLAHDREIAAPCDDSVTRVIARAPVVLRRGRGYVPRPIPLARPVARPVLAVGADLKNAFCIAAGGEAWLGPHTGDLENLDAARAFEEAVERMLDVLHVAPKVIAHDLHPGYRSTAYAQRRPEAVKVGVQHHHAHVASAMAEHGLRGPVIGVAYDGTGYGGDGTSWGGEVLLAREDAFVRLGTFRPIPLAGGDRAVREPWRAALAALDDAFDGSPPLGRIPLFRQVPERAVTLTREMIACGLNAPRAHGIGRWFDALGAIGLGRGTSRYEGELALAWNLAADPGERGTYPFTLDCRAAPWTVDLRPLVRRAVADLLAGEGAARISARFHNALAAATAALVREAAARHGLLPVVLTGGVFQNARLCESVRDALSPDLQVHLHGRVPPGDGGIALGQVVVADARASAGAG